MLCGHSGYKKGKKDQKRRMKTTAEVKRAGGKRKEDGKD